MLAFAMMIAVRERANRLTSPQKSRREARLQRWSAGLSRKSAASPPALPSIRSSPLSSSPGLHGDERIRLWRKPHIASEGHNCNA
jgi:hypothetical protein